MKTLSQVLLLILPVVLFSSLNAQIGSLNNHNFYYQKVIANSDGTTAVGTRIFDSLKVYGYISGYDPSQFDKLGWTGKYNGSDKFEKAVFIQEEEVDSINILLSSGNLPQSQKNYSEPIVDYGFILSGDIVKGAFWLFDLYYSEILNHAGVRFTDKTKVLCVYPWEKKDELHYRIVAVEENDDGQYEISYTYINYTNPLRPKIEKSGIAVITKEKFIDELSKQLNATSNVSVENQCASPGLPRLVALPEKRFFYSLPCLDQHGRERADEPMDLSLYVEKLFYKYLYEK